MKYNKNLPPWWPDFYEHSAFFKALAPVAKVFTKFQCWPDICQWNQCIKPGLQTASGKPINFIEQTVTKPRRWQDYYEPFIFRTGQIPSRRENWHDFLNMLCWQLYPSTKALLNKLQTIDCQHQGERGQLAKRTPRQNQLAHFDENGVIVISKQPILKELIINHQWQQLFVEHRDSFNRDISVIIFGHGFYEKAFNPFIGMTGKAIIITNTDDNIDVDTVLCETLQGLPREGRQQLLTPLPILGIPGWWPENEAPDFYDNRDYFRPLSNS